MTNEPHPEAPRRDGRGGPDDAGGPVEEGPPPPPPAVVEAARAERRRRRRLVLALLAAAVVVGTPVTLAVLAATSDPVAEPDGSRAPDDTEQAEPRPPDLEGLSGRDAAWGRLLRDIDESEQAMTAFQRELASIAERAGDDELSDPLDEIRAAAADGAAALEEARARLTASTGDGRLEAVRVAYLEHHDAWADYLDAVAEEPALVGASDSASQWRLRINTSGATFARELRDAVADARLAAEIRTYARDILSEGFGDPTAVPDA